MSRDLGTIVEMGEFENVPLRFYRIKMADGRNMAEITSFDLHVEIGQGVELDPDTLNFYLDTGELLSDGRKPVVIGGNIDAAANDDGTLNFRPGR